MKGIPGWALTEDHKADHWQDLFVNGLMPLTSNKEEKHLFDLLRGQSYTFLNKAVSYWGNVQINTNCVKMINVQYSEGEKKKKKSYKLNTIRAKRKWNTWLSHSRLENSCSWSGHRSKIKHPVGNRSHDASQPIVTVRVVTHEALTGTSFSVYICKTEAAECHVVVVKSSMEFNKRKVTVIIRWGRSSTPWCFLLGFSICFVLRLLLLRRLQPGEPLVDLMEAKSYVNSSAQLVPNKTVSNYCRCFI